MPCFSGKVNPGQVWDDYSELAISHPHWSPADLKALPRSERLYWTQFAKAVREREEKRRSDLITKLVERADQLLAPRRRR